MIATGMDQRHTQYVAGLAAASRLLATISPQPSGIEINCRTWSPEQVDIEAYAHDNLAAVRSWHSQLGGQLTSETRGATEYWQLTHSIADIPVKLWTLLDRPEPLPIRVIDQASETAVMDQWMRRHGDDLTAWPQDVHHAYAATIANMRAGGQL
jgi:hypothetical protein